MELEEYNLPPLIPGSPKSVLTSSSKSESPTSSAKASQSFGPPPLAPSSLSSPPLVVQPFKLDLPRIFCSPALPWQVDSLDPPAPLCLDLILLALQTSGTPAALYPSTPSVPSGSAFPLALVLGACSPQSASVHQHPASTSAARHRGSALAS